MGIKTDLELDVAPAVAALGEIEAIVDRITAKIDAALAKLDEALARARSVISET